MSQRFVRLAETNRARVRIVIDGNTVEALAGDTLISPVARDANAVFLICCRRTQACAVRG
jgi:hypothetical protein